MKNKHLLLFTLFLTMCCLSNTFAQCVIPITNDHPYIEGFEDGGFDCWTVEENGGSWSAIAGSESTVAYFTYHNTGDEARLISPILDMSAVASVTFSFSFAMIGLYQNDELVVSYRSSETDEWHDLGSFSYSNYSTVYEEAYTLEDLTSTYQVSFLGRGLGGVYMMVDNIEIASAGGCVRPLNLQVLETDAHSALLEWSTTGSEESWVLEVNGHPQTIDVVPFLLEGLEPETQYTFRVKANCGEGEESEWSLAMSFKTLCEVITVTDYVPFFDNFEASEEFLCWNNEIISGSDSWVIDPGYVILNNTAFFIWLGGEARLISAPLDITSVTNPGLIFNHKQPQGNAGTDSDDLSVWYRTSLNDEWHFLGEFTNVADNWEGATFTLPEPSSTYYISFKAKANNANGVYVDDVWVGKLTGEGVEETRTVNAVVNPNPAKDRAMISANTAEGMVEVFDLSGRMMTTTKLQNGNVEIDMSGFAQGVYMVRVSNAEGTSTIRLVKE